MAITIKKVTTPKELKTFIRFNYELYKHNPYSVPALLDAMGAAGQPWGVSSLAPRRTAMRGGMRLSTVCSLGRMAGTAHSA